VLHVLLIAATLPLLPHTVQRRSELAQEVWGSCVAAVWRGSAGPHCCAKHTRPVCA